MSTLITICARGGSKGIPGKNVKHLDNKPLIYYSLRVAEDYAVKNIDTTIVLSTDSEEIRDVVRNMNMDNVDTSYVRPSKLGEDSVGKIEVIKDVLRFFQQKHNLIYDYVIDLDVTSPLRTTSDIQMAFEKLLADENAYNIFSVNPANRNPYFNMVEIKQSGYISLCKSGEFLTRQSAPKVYDMNASFYIYRKNFFNESFKSAITDRSLVYIMPHICFDLDEPIDFDFMEYLILRNKLDFKFIK